jgi:hypothetical protein
VLLIRGTGTIDKKAAEALGFFDKNGPKLLPVDYQLARYLSERGFAVLRYDKRGLGANFTLDANVWGNATFNNLKEDAEKALAVLAQQPEVDPNKNNYWS